MLRPAMAMSALSTTDRRAGGVGVEMYRRPLIPAPGRAVAGRTKLIGSLRGVGMARVSCREARASGGTNPETAMRVIAQIRTILQTPSFLQSTQLYGR